MNFGWVILCNIYGEKKMKKPSIIKYTAFAIFIFLFAIFVSSCTRLVFVMTTDFTKLDNEGFSLITSMIDGAVGAIAAGFVLYQFKIDETVVKQEYELHEAEFYQHFIAYWLETDKLFLQYPECRKYFYDDADPEELKDSNPEKYQLVMGLAEYFDDLCRYSETEILRQCQGNAAIPKDQIESYNRYIAHIRSTKTFQHYRAVYGPWVNSTE